FFAQQTTDIKRIVADHLGIETETRSAGEQPVLRIGFELLWSHSGTLAISCRGDNQPHHMFDVPRWLRGSRAVGTHAAISKFACQPIQELGVRWPFALSAEVIRGFHQADAEELLPQSIDRDASGQRMISADEPAGKIQTIGG